MEEEEATESVAGRGGEQLESDIKEESAIAQFFATRGSPTSGSVTPRSPPDRTLDAVADMSTAAPVSCASLRPKPTPTELLTRPMSMEREVEVLMPLRDAAVWGPYGAVANAGAPRASSSPCRDGGLRSSYCEVELTPTFEEDEETTVRASPGWHDDASSTPPASYSMRGNGFAPSSALVAAPAHRGFAPSPSSCDRCAFAPAPTFASPPSAAGSEPSAAPAPLHAPEPARSCVRRHEAERRWRRAEPVAAAPSMLAQMRGGTAALPSSGSSIAPQRVSERLCAPLGMPPPRKSTSSYATRGAGMERPRVPQPDAALAASVQRRGATARAARAAAMAPPEELSSSRHGTPPTVAPARRMAHGAFGRPAPGAGGAGRTSGTFGPAWGRDSDWQQEAEETVREASERLRQRADGRGSAWRRGGGVAC